MDMDLTGIKNQNEYYTNHYFTSIFKENAEDTISAWRKRAKEEETMLPWHKFRDTRRQYNLIREQYLHLRNQELSKPMIQELAGLYLTALGYEERNSVEANVAEGITVPVFHEETKSNGAPLVWVFLSVCEEVDDDILNGHIYAGTLDEEETALSLGMINDDILAKLFFAGEEAPRFIILIGINQIALIDRNKWNEKRYLQFMLDDIFSRHEESTFMALTVLLHKESLFPSYGTCLLDSLDENSHKHSAGVSDALKYALRECIEILGNEVIYDMKTRQGIDIDEEPVDAGELTLECLRYMYRFLFMLFIEARPELGYAPMKSQTYVQGYSLEGMRDVCARVREESETVSEGYYIYDTISELFRMIYEGYPENLDEYKKAVAMESLHDVFTVEALKAHIFDPEYTKMITNARLRNSAMLRIVDLMSISRPKGSRERKGRISYSALGINQMGAVYEALLSYRGFIAQEILYEVKRAGDDFDELNVGYFIPENELENYTQEERVRVNKNDPKSPLRKYEKGTFIYRLAGREREKSASYYTPEVLTKCLVKYALKELLEGKTADEILNLTICEPAMGSAAFLNEAINQMAEAYLTKKQEELGEQIAFDERFEKLQQVKMYIADRNVYGVDLNPIAVELAEVSLWLNTIYKGAYVPWFGTQLVCGNSLIGARRQVYYTTKLENGKWYEEAPDRVMPGEKRKRTGVNSRVYHFLLGDPGMSNYTDKVVKGLEPDNIKKINDWRKEFTKKYSEDDIKTLLNLSEIIDTLWDRTVALRKKVEAATSEPFSVYGHEESAEGIHTTIREKDEIYKKMFKSEHMNNAGPYARLKAAMDYWCALWFWPIDKADLLPTRQIFFMEMYMILQGAVNTSIVGSDEQLNMFDDSGNMTFDDSGNWVIHSRSQQLVFDFASEYDDLGSVNLDDLRERNERFRIANQIAEEQRFHHWELEFADVFEERGGFDLVLGNPPWLLMTWNEGALLTDINPIFAIKALKAKDAAIKRDDILESQNNRKLYIKEYTSISGTQTYLNAIVNYRELLGMKANLFKCFLPKAWYIGGKSSIAGYVHPEGVYDDPKGNELRKEIYKRLKKHFQFSNELKLFGEVDHHMGFSLNIYSNSMNKVEFDSISNLFDPNTIDRCYSHDGTGSVSGIKDEYNNWNTNGHRDRILVIHEKELKLMARLFDGNDKWMEARLAGIHSIKLIEALEKIAESPKVLGDYRDSIYTSPMWNETNAQLQGYIKKEEKYPESLDHVIYSGPHIYICNPFYKSSRKPCLVNSDYDVVDLKRMEPNYIQRTTYQPCVEQTGYYDQIPNIDTGEKISDDYRFVARKMLNLSGERSLIGTIIAPKTMHINGLESIRFEDHEKMVLFAGMSSSIIFDYFIKTLGKSNLHIDTISPLPLFESKYSEQIKARCIMLTCLNMNYASLWEEVYKDVWKTYEWLIDDKRLRKDAFSQLDSQYQMNFAFRNDFERRVAMLELDVLTAKALNLSLEDIISIYTIQFPVLYAYDSDTWYDDNGVIVFTNNRGLNNVGLSRNVWDGIKDTLDGNISYRNEEDGMVLVFKAPFSRSNRVEDYKTIWAALGGE